jgi:hypothetical protein
MTDDDYRYLCIWGLGCAANDTHGHACERANDEARAVHYAAIAAEQYADAIEALISERLAQ